MSVSLDTPIERLLGVGSKVAEKLRRLKIKTAKDLVFHFPHRWEDFSNTKNIADLVADEKATVVGRIVQIGTTRTWKKKMMVTEAIVQDPSTGSTGSPRAGSGQAGTIRAVWFNQPYLTQTLKKDFWVSFSGKVALDKNGVYFSNPTFEVIGKELVGGDRIHTGGLVPIYPETRGLTSRWLRYKIHSLLSHLPPFEEFLPDFLVREFKLMPLDTAVRAIHFPKSQKQAREAQKRLAFNDLFLVQLFAAEERKKIKASPAPAIPTNVELIKKFVAGLPFQLTDSQRVSAWQILKDMEGPEPMNRLLEGDVGSGKTVVAAIAALNTADAGWQTAILTPTEILATQHYKTFEQIFKNFHSEIALLTSSQSVQLDHQNKTRKEIVNDVNSGKISVVIGTHALIQKEIKFHKLGLVVVDEQHRFGVEQRAHLLRGQRLIPHLLSVTATPIPRTLALTLYGDLDLSLIKELPAGRKKIMTRVVPPAKRADAYKFIEEQVKKGRQVFVICPLIEESKALEVRSVTQEYEKLTQKVFPSLRVEMLHGRMKPKEKEDIMREFKTGKIDILVSTAVVEVGIDVPNASVMMIEGADRFGLAQLHQFRGRVGRAEHQSYCFLFTDSPASPIGGPAKATQARLKALAELNDGFALAEKDLQIRGPGEFFGTAQSGLPDLAMASLTDALLIAEVQQALKYFLQKSSLEEHPKLAARLAEFQREVHWE